METEKNNRRRGDGDTAAGRPARLKTDGVDFWSVLHLLRDHLWIIALCAVAGAGLALAHVLHRPPIYVSRGVLEVAEDSAALASFGSREGADIESASLLKTIEQTVASQSVLRRVLEDLKLGDDPAFAPPRETGPYREPELIELLQRRLRVELVRGTRLIAVSAWDADREKAQRIAQGVIDEFFAQKLELNRQGTDAARHYLTAEAARVKQELTASEERLQNYRETHNAVSLSERHNLVMARLDELSRQVTEARSERLALEAEKNQVESLGAGSVERLLNIRGIAALPEIVELMKEINVRTAELAALGQRYRAKHPTLIEANRRMAETREGMRLALRRAGDAIVQAYHAARANEEMLQREFDQQEKLALELTRTAIPYRALEREAESNQLLYQQLLARLKQADVTQGLLTTGHIEGNRIRVTQQPLVPVRPSGMSGKILIAFGLVAGVGLGLAIALLRRALDNSLASVDEAEDYLGVPSLAVIHRSRLEVRRGELLVNTHPATIEAESFRSLRTALSLQNPEDGGRVAMFTSAMQGEGKSFCSLNHAACVAQQGLRTLLIDGDLRRAWLRPALVPDSDRPGLVDCLRNIDRLPDAITPTAADNLFVLGDRRGSTAGAALLDGPALARILERCAAEFDRVVVDTAPVTAVSDALHFARHIRTVCVVIHAGTTPRRAVRRACTLLDNATGRAPTGLILNQVTRGRAGSYYYYSNGEGYAEETREPARPAGGLLRAIRQTFGASAAPRRS